VQRNTGTQESDKIEYGMQFQREIVFTKKENLKQLMDEFNGIEESEWLLVGNLLNWIEAGKDNDW